MVAATPSAYFIAPVEGRVAKAGGVVDAVGAEKPGHLLRHVIDLVGHAARGDEECNAARITRANSIRDARVSFVPGNAAKALRLAFAEHGEGETAQFAQFGVGELQAR